MKAKYLGTYKFQLNDEMNYDTEAYDVLVNIDNENDWYPMEFINTDDNSSFNGIMGETNTSAIALKISNETDDFKLWRIW